MMEPQQIHEHVVVVAAQCALPSAPDDAHDRDDRSAEASMTTALQFTAVSSSLDAVTFRADFSASTNIRVHAPLPLPSCATRDPSDTLASGSAVDCEVFPFERRVLAHVVREPSKRAFVRVRYDHIHARALAVSEVEQAQQTAALTLRNAIERAHATHYANRVSVRVELSQAPWRITQRGCDAINRYFTSHDGAVRFVDASFPLTATSLSGTDNDEDDRVVDSADAALYALSTWRHLHDVLDADGDALWTLARSKSSRVLAPLQSPLPGQDSLLCALTFIAFDKTQWLKQLLPPVYVQDDSDSRKDSRALHDVAAISVHLCDRDMRWMRVLVDLYVPSFPLGTGLMGVASLLDGELYPMLLQKAYAKLRGSYRAIHAVSTLTILRELTGLPCVGRPHHCALPILRSDATRGVVLHNVNDAIAVAAPSDKRASREDDRNTDRAVTLSWSAFFALKPDVSVLLANHTEARRQRAVFVHPALIADAAQEPQQHVMQFALSVAELTSVGVSTQVEQHNGGACCRHTLTLDAVGADYSLTRVPTDAVSASSASRTPGVEDGSDLQLVVALGAGEYVLSVATDAASKSRPRDEQALKTHGLTPLDVDKTLELLFHCIDEDMDGTIDQRELQAFLRTHESEALAPERLTAFLTRFGCSDGDSAQLLLEDLRDVYQSLTATESLASNDQQQQQQQCKYEALVWSDLCHTLRAAPADDAIPNDALFELRCAIHSDVPLIDMARLTTPDAGSARAS